jgi:uncharacterized membrane protein
MAHNKQSLPKTAPGVDHDQTALERLVFFSDAVIAIAITLLVLDIHLPGSPADLDDAQLLQQLLGIWPHYLAYIISFLVIGSFWLSHHNKFRYIHVSNRRLVQINLLLLLLIAFIPFPTAVLSEYNNRTSTIFYALTIAAAGLVSAFLWIYASRIGHLVDASVPQRQIQMETRRALILPAVFLLSIGLAWFNADLAKYAWIIIAPLMVLMR